MRSIATARRIIIHLDPIQREVESFNSSGKCSVRRVLCRVCSAFPCRSRGVVNLQFVLQFAYVSAWCGKFFIGINKRNFFLRWLSWQRAECCLLTIISFHIVVYVSFVMISLLLFMFFVCQSFYSQFFSCVFVIQIAHCFRYILLLLRFLRYFYLFCSVLELVSMTIVVIVIPGFSFLDFHFIYLTKSLCVAEVECGQMAYLYAHVLFCLIGRICFFVHAFASLWVQLRKTA